MDWKGYVNTALFLSSNYVSNKSFQLPVSLIRDFEVLDAQISKQVAREFKEYFSLNRTDRGLPDEADGNGGAAGLPGGLRRDHSASQSV